MSSTGSSTFKLSGSDDELKDHVGHLVEVTGTPDESASASTGSSSTGDTASSSSGTGSTAGTSGSTASKSLKVESVRMVSATCPAQ